MKISATAFGFTLFASALAFGLSTDAEACIPAVFKSTTFTIRSPGRKVIEHSTESHERATVELVVPERKGTQVKVSTSSEKLLELTKEETRGSEKVYFFTPKRSGGSSIFIEVTYPSGTVEKIEQVLRFEIAPPTRGVEPPAHPTTGLFPGGC